MTGEATNALIPRELAIVFIIREAAQMRQRITDYEANATEPGNYFDSRVKVFLEETIVELRRAAKYLEDHDLSEDG